MMNLLFSINRKFIPLWEQCLATILRHGGASAHDIYVLHSDLTEADGARMARALRPQDRCTLLDVPAGLFEGFPETGRYPLQIYYRLAAPLLLPEALGRILYLDVDTVVLNSLVPLYTSDFAGTAFMACSHTGRFLDRVNQARLDLEEGVPYLNSGVLMMNLALLRGTLRLDDIRDYAERYKKRLILPDQDILTALFGSRALVLDSRIYNMTDRLYIQCQCSAAPAERLSIDWVRQNTVVVHYLGKPKPWQKGYVGPLGVFYKEELARAGG
ncbi:MAG TPA: glycosyltransferase family 8 protein [Candidatus Faecalibacterium faecipullorum]|uniref:Glycosyltransferase family 8 protein n=1 Tax=Candidatus Faecalibacterium faecipullorum TaxID=2838578 RepID=A0A9D2MCV7_9FIRM|nr:glycosyltransferase family 8 protein [Candidatus Faecalibacterium faecipullorum]